MRSVHRSGCVASNVSTECEAEVAILAAQLRIFDAQTGQLIAHFTDNRWAERRAGMRGVNHALSFAGHGIARIRCRQQ